MCSYNMVKDFILNYICILFWSWRFLSAFIMLKYSSALIHLCLAIVLKMNFSSFKPLWKLTVCYSTCHQISESRYSYAVTRLLKNRTHLRLHLYVSLLYDPCPFFEIRVHGWSVLNVLLSSLLDRASPRRWFGIIVCYKKSRATLLWET